MTTEPPVPGPERTPPRPPAKLGRHGRALWRSLTDKYDFDPHELPIVEAACRQRDDITLLEAEVRDNGLMTTGSMGQQRLSQAVTEVRLARGALAKLLGELALPAEVPDESAAGGIVAGPALTARGRRAQAAANYRWRRHRARRGEDDLPNGQTESS